MNREVICSGLILGNFIINQDALRQLRWRNVNKN